MGFDTERAERATAELLASFGIDPKSPELKDTPSRVAAFWAERMEGYNIDLASELQPMAGQTQLCPVILERIPFASTCEHHLAPFFGHTTLGYIPGTGGIVGLSKLIRVVHAFANRLQVQERMTWEIFNALEIHLRPQAWGVRVVAEHTCVAHRGVKTPDVPVTTILLGGSWQQSCPKAFQ
ncbi:MAG: GTP cyclohydrolase I FolE [Holophagales bacterium]|jgi:GTP cyclohydrolase I|nr:GTP cyclohydrolase I FolE [Holophagales bacterium]